MLQVFHPEPVPASLALFLTKARADFCKVASKKPGISLSEGVNLAYSLFSTDKLCRGVCIQMLRPESITVSDYLLFRVCHKMAKLGLQPDKLFSQIDLDKSRTIEREEMVDGLKSVLELAIQTEEAELLFEIMDDENSGTISEERFLSLISFNNLNQFSSKHIISLNKYLDSLIETYKVVRIKDRALINGILRKYPSLVDKKTIESILTENDCEYVYEGPEKIHKEKLIPELLENWRRDFNIKIKSK